MTLTRGMTLGDDAGSVRASHGVLGRLGELLLWRQRRRQGRALGGLLRSGVPLSIIWTKGDNYSEDSYAASGDN